MIKILGSIPKTVIVAVSGGADSMICLDFIRGAKLPLDIRESRGRRVLVLHFDHGTEHGAEARVFVEAFCKANNIPCVVGSLTRERERGESKEAFWREERYRFFDNWHKDGFGKVVVPFDKAQFIGRKIVTCHHLDDQVETWIFSSLHGNPKLIPHSRDNYIRPFILSSKKDLLTWRNHLCSPTDWVEDPSNSSTNYMRNFIRHELMKNALVVNPGLPKTIGKKIKAEYEAGLEVF